jgi:carboxyl-terminal processing protease
MLTTSNGKMARVQSILENNYYEDIDKDVLLDGAISGMASSLDLWTGYMNQKEFTEFSTAISGSYAGIGITITADPADNTVVVVAPFEDTPAQAAGLATGDKILKVDGEEVFGDKTDIAAAKMKGVPGTEVILTVLKHSDKEPMREPIEIPIIRANVIIKSVISEMKEDKIGYIQIATFDGKTYDEFKENYDKLKAEGMQKLIIDLRNNPGGVVEVTERIADMFLGGGETIYSIKGKNVKERTVFAKGAPEAVPVAILVNGDSASASEILTGALKDNGRAIVIGEPTYGKGVMQQLMPLEDGGAIKVTIAKYFTPNGTDIDHIGIEPDHIVAGEEAQLQKAMEVLK